MTRLRPVPDQPRRGIGYVRVSMAREEMISPELQRASIERYCEQQGIVLVDVIEELDQSGRNFARAGVQDAIARIERGEADAIVVWKISRFGRTRRDWYVHADRVEVAGGTVESATESFDPLTSTGRLTRGMLVELAAWESDVKSEQWKEAFTHRREAGVPHSPGPRFGYLYDSQAKSYRPDPVTAPLLADMYRRYVAGESPRRIADWLNSVGSRTTTGGMWTPSTVRTVLASGFGAGLLYRRRTKQHFPGAHEPVVDQRTWKAYLARHDRQATEPPRAKAGGHPLTGLVICAGPPADGWPGEVCGANMNVWSGNVKGKHYRGYRCRRCRRNYVGYPALTGAVKAWLEAEVAADLDAVAETKAQRVARRTLARSEKAGIERQIRELDRSLVRLTEALGRGITPESAYSAARDAILAEQDGLQRRLLEVDDDAQAARRDPRPLARKILRDYDLLAERDPAGLKEVLRQLVREILVKPGRVDDKIEVVPRWA